MWNFKSCNVTKNMLSSNFKKIISHLQNQKQHSYLLYHQLNTYTNNNDQQNCLQNWSQVITNLVQNDTFYALANANNMFNNGIYPNAHVIVHLIRASTKRNCIFYGLQLHSYVIRKGFHLDMFASTALIDFYVKKECLSNAHKVFSENTQASLVSWNSLISGYVKSGQYRKALNLFIQLERSSDLCADMFSFTAALSACGQLGLLKLGESIHSKIVKFCGECDVFVANCLIDMYGKCGAVKAAIYVFNRMDNKDTISWNSVISACARNQKLRQARSFLNNMPNPDTISYNELINGVAQFGNIDDAIEILDSMPSPNSSSWNSIITGYVNRDQAREALEFFCKMYSKDIRMDQFTFSIILSGIANISALTWGILIHCCTIKCGLESLLVVGSALIDMYSKCGQVENAEFIFGNLPAKNLVTWNAMICGFAHNGSPNEVIELYETMKTVKDLRPDGITFLNVLTACWHNQAPFEVANKYFNSMVDDYSIRPTPEHCASLIRLMGKWGEVFRAEKIIYEQGFGSCGLVWRALLGACVICGDMRVAEVAAAKVFELEGDREFVYVMMSNMYASCGKWSDMSVMREVMRTKSVRKEVGCSWIEIDGVATT